MALEDWPPDTHPPVWAQVVAIAVVLAAALMLAGCNYENGHFLSPEEYQRRQIEREVSRQLGKRG